MNSKQISVIPTRFKKGTIYGDFKAMCETIKTSNDYKNAVCLFNDNHKQWLLADPKNPDFKNKRNHLAGGGNASCRPFQIDGHSIGIPTGPYKSLNQIVTIDGNKKVKVKTIIDMACDRIVDLFIKYPNKNILYYSINPDDPADSIKLGLGIFKGIVGKDVIDYITSSIHFIPDKYNEKINPSK